MEAMRRGSRLAQALAGTVVVLAAAPGVAHAAANAGGHHEAAEAGRWSLLFALIGLAVGITFVIGLAVVLSWLARTLKWLIRPRGKPLPDFGTILWPWHLAHGAVIGKDNRLSTSKTIAAIWTYSVASALLSLVIAKWMGHGLALVSQDRKGIQGNYGLLVGGPLGAAILAKGIVSAQEDKRSGRKAGGTPAASQLVANDQGETDLGDLQYVLFNAVALVFFFGELLRAPYLGLPNLPDLLVGLTSVSAAGYLGKKALSPTGLAITRVEPARGRAETVVTIAGPSLVPDRRAPTAVRFGDSPGDDLRVVSDAREGPLITVRVPTGTAAGEVDLCVTTSGGEQVTWDQKFEVLS